MESERLRYSFIFAICVLLSVAWVAYDAIVNKVADAGRGGAIAVAISLATLFLSRGYENDPLSVMTTIISTLSKRDKSSESLEQRITIIERDINVIMDGINSSKFIADRNFKYQNLFLALGSVIGTIAWAFGDCAADWLRKLLISWALISN